MADGTEPARPRFVVGIDLGTTNSAVCYCDTEDSSFAIQVLAIPQLVAPGVIERRETLPSFHYEAAPNEFSAADLQLPWSSSEANLVGAFARDHGTLVPSRLITSAKSWLCHPGVDRTAAILPWHGPDDVTRLSPVEVSSRYLAHLRAAWNAAFPEHPLEKQEVVLTIPASFDEVARELTVAATTLAGIPRVVLLEEPQAAFYSWIDLHRDDWQTRIEPGQKILVCDIGGGTSDFTLIRVQAEADDRVRFHRIAVGEHLILGGDNFDLALAHYVEKKLAARQKLNSRQWSVLLQLCRGLKERFLGPEPPESQTVSLPMAGSKLIGGALQVELTQGEVHDVLMEGFLPQVPLDSRPARRASGFQEFGLPYAPEPAITKYLAAFLTTHRRTGLDADETAGHDTARPDVVLFNGGLFASPTVRERIVSGIANWFSSSTSPDAGAADWKPLLLEHDRLDLAVARGAAYFGLVRRGIGQKISAGLARSYSIGVAGHPPQAVCLLPAGTEPGQTVTLESPSFSLKVGDPIEIPVYYSSVRMTDKAGDVIPVEREQLSALPPIRTVLKSRSLSGTATVPVQLEASLTEIGTLDLQLRERDGRRTWKLLFDVRAVTQTDAVAHTGSGEQAGIFDEQSWSRCEQVLHDTFGKRGNDPAGIMKRLERELDLGKSDWPPSLLRRIWETLFALEQGRRKSANHEARWLNLLGYALRPGYGLALDDWRVAETYRLLQGKILHAVPACRIEAAVLWRRVAGGLTAGQQQSLAGPILSLVRGQQRRQSKAVLQQGTHEQAEQWRLLGSFELLSPLLKVELGDLILTRLLQADGALQSAYLWTLGRLGSRQPVYGPLNTVVSTDRAAAWLQEFADAVDITPTAAMTIMQLTRRTGDRFRDVPEDIRQVALKHLRTADARSHLIELVEHVGTLTQSEQTQLLGDSLPVGLAIAE